MNSNETSQIANTEQSGSPIYTFNEDTFEVFGENLSLEDLLNLRKVSSWMKSMVENYCQHKRDLVIHRAMSVQQIKILGSLFLNVVSLKIKDSEINHCTVFIPQRRGAFDPYESIFIDVCKNFPSIQKLCVNGFRTKDRVEFLVTQFYWTGLKHLDLKNVNFRKIDLTPYLPQLESFSLEINTCIASDYFLENAKNLKHFMYRDSCTIFALIVVHKLSLKSIELHCEIQFDETNLRCFQTAESLCLQIDNFNDSQFSSLLKFARLKYLTIDVGGNDYFKLTKSFINTLTKMTTLQKFTLKDNDCARIKYISHKHGNTIIRLIESLSFVTVLTIVLKQFRFVIDDLHDHSEVRRSTEKEETVFPKWKSEDELAFESFCDSLVSEIENTVIQQNHQKINLRLSCESRFDQTFPHNFSVQYF
ncbi:hypothetical protein B4U80_14883 [Leptotrombidium deliense]|uniref:F-box domain-containing protein n=1 Tax=Leptotrombidium deliense TaxID=299467 RepID=A0A443S7W1_9ACAR|nr:hypothetical protein B4U80_14883 [Leptotrombidium deliense]